MSRAFLDIPEKTSQCCFPEPVHMVRCAFFSHFYTFFKITLFLSFFGVFLLCMAIIRKIIHDTLLMKAFPFSGLLSDKYSLTFSVSWFLYHSKLVHYSTLLTFCRGRSAGEDACSGWRWEAHSGTSSRAPIFWQLAGPRWFPRTTAVWWQSWQRHVVPRWVEA